MKKACADKLIFASNDIVLLITGCIQPRTDQRFLVLKDTKERLAQYIESIKFYIMSSPFSNIVFCENSAYPYNETESLVELAQRYGKNFAWLSFQGDEEKILECGKGYGEGEIIEYALMNSELLHRAKYFAKVTGRLKVKNIDYVVQNTKYGSNYFNRDIYRGHGIDTRFYLCEMLFYKQHLIKVHEETCELPGQERAIEDLFWPILHRNKRCRNLNAYPVFIGCSGGNGRDYSHIPESIIELYSVLCRLNIFNTCYAIVLGFKKLRLILSEKC